VVAMAAVVAPKIPMLARDLPRCYALRDGASLKSWGVRSLVEALLTIGRGLVQALLVLRPKRASRYLVDLLSGQHFDTYLIETDPADGRLILSDAEYLAKGRVDAHLANAIRRVLAVVHTHKRFTDMNTNTRTHTHTHMYTYPHTHKHTHTHSLTRTTRSPFLMQMTG
jgi:hypothetical protein